MKRLIPLALSFFRSASSIMSGTWASPVKPPAKEPVQHKEQVKPKTHTVETKAAAQPENKNPKVSAAEIDAAIASATSIDALTLLQTPDNYLNKKVTFTGTFNRFADIALDYKKAFRDSRDYVTFFILRPDVSSSTIPLSELKLFFPRKKSTEVMDLEAGDRIQIVGTEFSTALAEPWVDVEHIRILQKTANPERKHNTPEF